ncbi:unnamed protein product [Phytophthora fragariaefolia]|uniref:Unnamed protein product n=1 Tax=Phytophthora fragariaefolia TaxID=1490495 RepID=A0A9W6XQI7_9STRA|nr:unnamed protein product [Phytophthora fragariaefolia]
MRGQSLVLAVACLILLGGTATASAASNTATRQFLTLARFPSAGRSDLVFSRNLRDDDSDERVFNGVIERVASAAKVGAEKVKEKALLALGKSADDAFDSYKVVFSEKLLDSPEFTKWSNYVTKLTKNDQAAMTKIADTLTRKIGEDALVSLIVAAKKPSGKPELAKNLENGLLQAWANDKKSANAVFYAIDLNTAKDTLFGSPNLQIWANYVTKLNNGNSDASWMAMVQTLGLHYDPLTLARLINYATGTVSVGHLASGMQSAQFSIWRNAGATADDIFKFLELGGLGDKIFASNRFSIWEKYVGELHKQRQSLYMASILASHYGDDGLVKLIEATKKASSNVKLANKLQEGLLQHWRMSKKTSDNVFTLLHLEKKGGFLIGSQETKLWSKFVLRQHNNDEQASFAEMVNVMSKHYELDALARYIQSAKVSPSVGKFASSLQSAQFAEWNKREDKSDIIKTLLTPKPLSSANEISRNKEVVKAFNNYIPSNQ